MKRIRRRGTIEVMSDGGMFVMGLIVVTILLIVVELIGLKKK